MLSPAQVDAFRADGYLVIEGLLGAAALRALREAVDELTERAQGLTATTGVYDVVPGTGGGGPTVVRRIFHPAEVDPRLEEVALSADVLDAVEALIGPDIEYHHGKINMKPPGHDAEVGWHQDLPFFPHTNADLVAVMIYLDDATEENGCLTVVPGSHALGPLDHFAGDHFIGMVTGDLARVDLSRAVRLPVRAGGATIHHSLMLHSSAANASPRPRRALISEYRAADSMALCPDAEVNARHYGRLLRGRRPGTLRLEPRVFRIPTFAPDLDPRSLYDMQEEHRQRSAGGPPASGGR